MFNVCSNVSLRLLDNFSTDNQGTFWLIRISTTAQARDFKFFQRPCLVMVTLTRKWLPYFLEILRQWDFISRPCLMWQQFEGGVYRDRHMYAASIMSLLECMYNACVNTHIVVDSLPCGDILRVAFIGVSWLKYAVTFWGWWDFEVWQDFEEIRNNVHAQYGWFCHRWSHAYTCTWKLRRSIFYN